MPYTLDFTSCVLEGRQDYPDPDSDFTRAEVEEIVSANRETILECHQDDSWFSSGPSEADDIDAEFLRLVRFTQQASEADPNGGTQRELRFSELNNTAQAKRFHNAQDLLYGLEPYIPPSRLSDSKFLKIAFGVGGAIVGLVGGVLILRCMDKIKIFDKQRLSVVQMMSFLAGTTALGALAGITLADKLPGYIHYDSHKSHILTHEEIMEIETEAVEE